MTLDSDSPATVAAHAGIAPDPLTGAVVPPLVLTSIFAHGNPGGYEYAREGNPTWEKLESALASLEGGAGAVVLASGIAAIAAVVERVPVGARVVVPHNAYSGTRRLARELHARGRIVALEVDITDTGAVRAACEGAALCCLETVTNPMLTVPALDLCIDAARAAGATTLVDSTLTTPFLLRPLQLGADIVVHSLTKYVGGHSDLVLGAAVMRTPELAAELADRRTWTGAIPGQLETWLALRGLRTLEVRLHRQMCSAAVLAERLVAHPAVVRVHYPGLAMHPQHDRAVRLWTNGFGALISVELRGDADAAESVCRSVRLWTHATSLGGVESTLERRARYDLDAEVAPASLLRLSVGIEDVDDLWRDLERALAALA